MRRRTRKSLPFPAGPVSRLDLCSSTNPDTAGVDCCDCYALTTAKQLDSQRRLAVFALSTDDKDAGKQVGNSRLAFALPGS